VRPLTRGSKGCAASCVRIERERLPVIDVHAGHAWPWYNQVLAARVDSRELAP
jgi:hypothetical protein